MDIHGSLLHYLDPTVAFILLINIHMLVGKQTCETCFIDEFFNG